MLVYIQNKTISTEMIISVSDIIPSHGDYGMKHYFFITFIGGSSTEIFWDEIFHREELDILKKDLRNASFGVIAGTIGAMNRLDLETKLEAERNRLSELGKKALEKTRIELINLWQGSTSPIKIIEAP